MYYYKMTCDSQILLNELHGTREALLVINKNKAIDCCLKLNKINFVYRSNVTD